MYTKAIKYKSTYETLSHASLLSARSLLPTLRRLASLIQQKPPTHISAQAHKLPPEQLRQRHNRHAQHGLKHKRAMHVTRRVRGRPILEGVHDDDEHAAEQLAAGPADDGGNLRRDGKGDLDEVLEGGGHEGEGGGAEHGEDRERRAVGPRLRRPRERQVRGADYRRQRPRREQVRVRAVQDRRRHRRGDEPDDDEEAAGDARLRLAVVVWAEDLVDQ